MTSGGGANGDGTVFSIPVSGGTLTTLLDFNGPNGAYPTGSLILSGSTLYGMTGGGGNGGYGTIFSEPVTGGTPTTLFSFDYSSGSQPFGSLILSGSTLYGTTHQGGLYGYGTIFSEPVTGGTPTVLCSFSGSGQGPYGSLILSGSTLYGMTEGGGTNGTYGTIFSEPVTGGTPTTLFSFPLNGAAGADPHGSLILSGSTLYGMTSLNGANGSGTIFSEPVTGGTPTTLFSFSANGVNGAEPAGSLILSGSTLYGMTEFGGANTDGTIFAESVAGGTPTTLVSFTGDDGSYPGAAPMGDLTLSGSTLYGMTQYGGANGDGTVFALTLPTPEPSTFALLAAGAISLVGYGWRRRRVAKRTAQPEPQDDSPATLAFPSQSSHHSARRAA
jgi:uncharacterized repeat protein (TIGR03803 family)